MFFLSVCYSCVEVGNKEISVVEEELKDDSINENEESVFVEKDAPVFKTVTTYNELLQESFNLKKDRGKLKSCLTIIERIFGFSYKDLGKDMVQVEIYYFVSNDCGATIYDATIDLILKDKNDVALLTIPDVGIPKKVEGFNYVSLPTLFFNMDLSIPHQKDAFTQMVLSSSTGELFADIEEKTLVLSNQRIISKY